MRFACGFPPVLALLFLAVFLDALPAATAGAPSSPQSPQGDAKVPFEEIAADFIKLHGIQDLPLDEEAFPKLLEREYLVMRLGVFDCWMPRYYLEERPQEAAFKEMAHALLEAQFRFAQACCDKETRERIEPDFKTLNQWIDAAPIARNARNPGEAGVRPDALQRMDAGEAVMTASERIDHFMRMEIGLGPAEGKDENVLLLLSPTRKDFLGLGSFLGKLSPRNQAYFWKDNLALWTSFIYQKIHTVVLEHPTAAPGQGDIFAGLDMNTKEKTGLLEHLVQHAMEYLLRFYFNASLHEDVAKGLAIDMVIEMFGENNVRAGGARKGKSVGPRSRFVAGAASDGRLPPADLDSRWRKGKGKDYFVKVLKDAQLDGGKEAKKARVRGKELMNYFALEPDAGGSDRITVKAPFLKRSSAPSGPTVPEAYEDDALEFMRAYRGAFVYWLRNRAESALEKAPSQELFLRILKRTGKPVNGGAQVRFESLVEEIYGKPLTPEEGKDDALEIDFVRWLAAGGK